MSAGKDPASCGQGASYQGEDRELLIALLEAAFDYRGDVTLFLEGGERLLGYLSNRDFRTAEPFVELLLEREHRPQRIPLARVKGVELTGKDPALGKSWETWLRKYKAKLEAEARGEKVGSIGLFPEALD